MTNQRLRILFLPILFFIALSATGCAEFKTYMRDRGNDLADCFTVRAGIAYGLGVRTQVTTGLGVSVGASLNEKKWGYFGRSHVDVKGYWVGLPVVQPTGLVGAIEEAFEEVPVVPPWVVVRSIFITLIVTDVSFYEDSGLPWSTKVLGISFTSGQRMEPPTPFLREKFFIEVGATLGAVGFDVGFNPVEFVDFLLGWFTIDITGDDAQQKAEADSEPLEEEPPKDTNPPDD